MNNEQYGEDLGRGIKKGIQGLNTTASPKNREICIRLCIFPLVGLLLVSILYSIFHSDLIAGVAIIPALSFGACQFYVGNFKKGLIYTFTCGLFLAGILSDLFRLKVTKTFRDANGFPIIY